MEIKEGNKYKSKCRQNVIKYKSKSRQNVIELDVINKGEEFILSDYFEDIDDYFYVTLHHPRSCWDVLDLYQEQFELTFEEVNDSE